MSKGKLGALLLASSMVAGGLVLAGPVAGVAAPGDEVSGNVTVLASGPRLSAAPGTPMGANEIKTFKVAGNFGIPANATGVILNVNANRSDAAGRLTVWGGSAGQPGTPTVSYAAGQSATNVSVVGLNAAGEFRVFSSAKANALLQVTGYVTPETAAPAPVIKTIPSVERKTIDVGGSFRTRSTVLGSIELSAGTYDARVLGSFTGFNNGTELAEDITVTGTMAITLGTEVKPDFSNNITVGGITIPRSNSDTLTQDPTAAINTFFTLTETTTVQVRVFGYASNSSQQDGVLKAGLDSATFLKIS